VTNTDTVLGYRRPAMLGGPASPDPGALTVRWYGTSNFELNFHDRVVLLDTFYDRGPRMRGLGFRPDEVVRADAVLIGHPHYDHISDAAQVASATGAPVVVHPLGADVLTQGGLDASRIHAVTGRGEGDLLEFPEFTLRVIHGFHADLTHPEQQMSLEALRQAREVWERDEPPLSPAEEAHAAAVLQRGTMAPEVFTEGTMCLVIDIDGYRIVYRDSGGPVSEEERAFFAASPGCDLAIVGFIGRPLVRRQLQEATMPLIETYQPRAVIPCHHDDLYPVFIDLATEPLKMRVHEQLPAASTIQPVYVEPVTIGMKSQLITVGDPRP
jgi:L-ascorbate metabolism protein UlaG (beta-lactamase superfamily)